MQVQVQMRMNQMQMQVQMHPSHGNQMQVQVQMPHLHLHLQMQVHLSTSLGHCASAYGPLKAMLSSYNNCINSCQSSICFVIFITSFLPSNIHI